MLRYDTCCCCGLLMNLRAGQGNHEDTNLKPNITVLLNECQCCLPWNCLWNERLSALFMWLLIKYSLVHLLSCVQLFATTWTAACQVFLSFTICQSLSYPSPSPRGCSNSCPLSRWCHSTILSSVISFSSCLQSFPASGSFPVSWLFTSDGHSHTCTQKKSYW